MFYTASATEEHTKGTILQLTANLGSESCIFMAWTAEDKTMLSNAPTISVKMDKDKMIMAHYISNGNKLCFKLAKLAQDMQLKENIKILRNKNSLVEHAFLKKSNNEIDYQTGTRAEIPILFEDGVKYSQIFHSHPSGVARVSAGDLLVLHRMLVTKKNIDNINDFRFGVITQENVMNLSILDTEAFKEYFKEFKSSEAFIRFFNKKIKATPYIPYNEMSNSEKYSFNERMLKEIAPLIKELGLYISFSNTEKDINKNMINNWTDISVNSNTINYTNCLK